MTGETFDSIVRNPGGQTGQLQTNLDPGGAGGTVSINLPNQTQQTFDTSGLNTSATGEITRFAYIYDLVGV